MLTDTHSEYRREIEPNDATTLAWKVTKNRLEKEIDLLWRRGLFFWTFIAATFVGYGTQNSEPYIKEILAAFGFLLSFVWVLANLGSRYWQKVWEEKLIALEVNVTGPVYGWNPNKTEDWSVSSARFSVSKLAISVSILSTLAWFAIILVGILSHGGTAGAAIVVAIVVATFIGIFTFSDSF